MPNTMLGERLRMTEARVRKWCKRFIDEGIDGLYDFPGAGRPRTYEDDAVAQLMQQALETRPKDGTHRTQRCVASNRNRRGNTNAAMKRLCTAEGSVSNCPSPVNSYSVSCRANVPAD